MFPAIHGTVSQHRGGGSGGGGGGGLKTDFNGHPVGVGVPAGWTDRWVPTTWEVRDTLAPPEGTGPNALYSAGSGNKLLSWDALDAIADPDIEILVLGRFHSSFSGHPTIRASGAAGSENGYAVRARSDSSGHNLVRFSNGSVTTLATFGYGFGTRIWLWVRLRAQGNQIKAKVWSPGGPEPAEWGAEVTDNTHSDAGWAGFGGRLSEAVVGSYFSAAFGGATAPGP